jgi:hypothetical protein
LNNGSSDLHGSSITLDTSVKGHGSIRIGTAQGSGGRLEFGDSVSSGQNVAVFGDPGRNLASLVQIDKPEAFKGSVALGAFGKVDLVGLTGADSYLLKDDILSIYSGCTVIDKVRLTTPPPPSGPPFEVTVVQTSTGIDINRNSTDSTGIGLPVHQSYG